MKKKAWLVTLVASLGAGAVLAQSTNTVAPATPSTPAPAPAISTPAPEAVPTVAPVAAPSDATASTNAATPAKAKKKAVAKKPVAKAVSTGLPAAHVLLEPPVPATVKVDSLNLRGQPSLSGEVIAKLKKGETVTILEEVTLDKVRKDEPAKWVKIQLSTNVPVWVAAHLIDPATKAVTVNKLNLRGGAGEDFNVLGTLEKGAVVKEIKTKGSWIHIETPANAGGYVSADFLDKKPAPETNAAPAALSSSACRTTICSTSTGRAPSATRMPNSRVRCAALYATMPLIPIVASSSPTTAKPPIKIAASRCEARLAACAWSSVCTPNTGWSMSTSRTTPRIAGTSASGSPVVRTTSDMAVLGACATGR